MTRRPKDTSLVLLAPVGVGVVVGDVLRRGPGALIIRAGMVGLWKGDGQCHELVVGKMTTPIPTSTHAKKKKKKNNNKPRQTAELILSV